MKYNMGLKLWSINTDRYFHEAERLYNLKLIDYVELYVVPDTLETLQKWKTLEIPFIIHNAHFAHGFNLAKSSHFSRNLEIYQQSKQFADELGAKYIIFHGGIDGSIQEVARQLQEIQEPRALIENKPFKALPNRMGGEFCRGAVLEELKYLLSLTQCGFCLDFGHAVCSANSQKKDPYSFISELMDLSPSMFHLSDVSDMTSIYDAHPHLGTGSLDIARLKKMLPEGALVSIETNKDSKDNLFDFEKDIECWKQL